MSKSSHRTNLMMHPSKSTELQILEMHAKEVEMSGACSVSFNTLIDQSDMCMPNLRVSDLMKGMIVVQEFWTKALNHRFFCFMSK